MCRWGALNHHHVFDHFTESGFAVVISSLPVTTQASGDESYWEPLFLINERVCTLTAVITGGGHFSYDSHRDGPIKGCSGDCAAEAGVDPDVCTIIGEERQVEHDCCGAVSAGARSTE